ncbi:DUF6046 domain-containing protein [Flavobacterium sp. I-SCBP12n]|uniref:DUF6046 domain-containing protein n=1 Tax=Flavobacterium pygoscelis TaxID=2893176 RepID=A0A9X1XUZ4_9FLAO|nr:DUF6046 domain-containing protein [Flavobacterium pygoscelis]MCK8143211.1 DUF6046 domain-containing protein [Flavobacterium pygoscelis]
MNNNDILFASLVGSKIIEKIPRLTAVQNELMKHVLPPLPFLPFRNNEAIAQVSSEEYFNHWEADKSLGEEQQFFPLSMSIDEGKTYFRLPYEPLISIAGKNVIAKRRVAKWNAENSNQLTGSIKERWSQDDYEITITGALMGALIRGSYEDCYPRADFEKLKKVLTNSKEIWINCPPLELLGINKIVIDDFSFPFTKGENVQAYEIKASSDYSYNLLMEI